MSLEQKIEELTTEVRHLVEIMQRLRVPGDDSKSNSEPEPKPKAAPAAEEKRELTKAELNDLCLTLSREGRREVVAEHLASFGANRINELDHDQFVAFQDLIIEEVERLG